MFISSCGLAQISYFVGMESRHISVINGCEKGGSLKKIKQAVSPDMLNHLKPNYHMFLDSLTGDLFSYDKDK